MFSSKIRTLVKKSGLDPGISFTYLFAKANGYPTTYFEYEYDDIFGDIPVSEIINEKLDPQWVKEWLKLWPTLSQIQRVRRVQEYSISGNAPEVKKRLNEFLKQFCERLEVDDCSLSYKLDIIWRATEAYLKDLESKNYAFAKKNHKFIKDTNGSVLEDWCRRIINNETNESTSFTI